MFRLTSAISASILCMTSPLAADAPNVVTDFGPTQAIVARVMQGAGVPDVLLTGADNPHDFALRPSQARTLSEADIVVWLGPDMTPWLDQAMAGLGENAQSVTLLDVPGWDVLDIRESDGHNHDHGDHDPHAWLDPDIAAIWAMEVSAQLSAADPENASLYQTNANQLWADLAQLGQEMDALLAEIDGTSVLLPHDIMQYFEVRFGFSPAGFIADSDAKAPGPSHLLNLRKQVEAGEVTCILREPETNPGWIALLTEGTDAKTGTLDAIDRAGNGYIAMMRTIAEDIAACAR